MKYLLIIYYFTADNVYSSRSIIDCANNDHLVTFIREISEGNVGYYEIDKFMNSFDVTNTIIRTVTNDHIIHFNIIKNGNL